MSNIIVYPCDCGETGFKTGAGLTHDDFVTKFIPMDGINFPNQSKKLIQYTCTFDSVHFYWEGFTQ